MLRGARKPITPQVVEELLRLAEAEVESGRRSMKWIAALAGFSEPAVRAHLIAADFALYRRLLSKPERAGSRLNKPHRARETAPSNFAGAGPVKPKPFIGPPIYRSDFIRGDCEAKVRGAHA